MHDLTLLLVWKWNYWRQKHCTSAVQSSFCNQNCGLSGALVDGHHHSEGACCILPQRWRQRIQSHLAPSYEIVWCHISDICDLNTHHCGNLKSECLLMCNEIKSVPLQAWSGPEGSRKLRFPDYMTTAQDGRKVISLTHRPPLPRGNAPGTHFC